MDSYSSNFNRLELQRRQLEQLARVNSPSSSQWLKGLGQWLVTLLTEANQLQVRTKQTREGQVWQVHDPLSNQYQQFDSEEALRVWLEQRHSR